MSETITLNVDPVVKSRIELCRELGFDVSELVSDAFNIHFRKLITEGKIKADLSVISKSSALPETEYSLTESDVKKYPLTHEEIAGLSPAQAKNYDKAQHGDPKALNVMGTYYESGNGFTKDYDRAIYWYTLAAENGNTNAQYHLAILYNKVKDNPLKSYYWFEVARLCGFNITALHQDYILRLAERLSARQIQEAQAMAERKFSEIKKRS